jgi:hypothetical protein
VKEQLTNQLSEIHVLKFVSILNIASFKYCSGRFPATAYVSLLKSYVQYSNSLHLKTELYIIYLSEEFFTT